MHQEVYILPVQIGQNRFIQRTDRAALIMEYIVQTCYFINIGRDGADIVGSHEYSDVKSPLKAFQKMIKIFLAYYIDAGVRFIKD